MCLFAAAEPFTNRARDVRRCPDAVRLRGFGRGFPGRRKIVDFEPRRRRRRRGALPKLMRTGPPRPDGAPENIAAPRLGGATLAAIMFAAVCVDAPGIIVRFILA